MAKISTTDHLRELYRQPAGRALDKELTYLEKHCRNFIAASPFMILGTSQTGGGPADVSPRGDGPGFVKVLDDHHLAIPDRPGNNRLDSLTNILANPEVALIFLLPGVDETLRINGMAEIRDDQDLLDLFEVKGKKPAIVLVVKVREAYLHCAKALMRSRLWDPSTAIERSSFPSMGRMIADQVGEKEEPESQEEMVERYKKALY